MYSSGAGNGGVLKSGWVIVNPENTRIIDSNEKAEARLREIAVEFARQCGEEPEPDGGFMEGLNAAEVMGLMSDEDGAGCVQDGQEENGHTPDGNAQQAYEEIVAKAQAEVDKLKQQAVAEIEELRAKAQEQGQEQGYQEGFEQGKKQGYEDGRKEGLESVEKLKEKALLDAKNALSSLENRYQKKFNELEPKFIDTLTGIYEHIFHVSFRNSRELIVYLIQNTMHNIEGGSSYLIHVSREDYPFASMQKRELIKNTNINIDNVELLEDATLGKNECMIETGSGVFDCSLGTQLEALNQELRLLSYEP